MTFINLVGPSEMKGPTADMIPKDTPTEWSVFKIGEGYGGGPLLVKDGQDIPTRQWITYLDKTDGLDHVGLWDGKLCRMIILEGCMLTEFTGVTPQSRPFENITLVVTNV